MSAPGYFGKSLAAKLGVKAGTLITTIAAPPDYAELIAPAPEGASIKRGGENSNGAFIHLFATRAGRLERRLSGLRKRMPSDGVVWVSWPKKAAKVPTDVTEDVVRSLALPLGLVDVKVCAVSKVWSGLKLVLRRSER